MRTGTVRVVLLFLVTASLLAGCASDSPGKRPIVVGSKIDTEGALLANMIMLALKN